MAKPVNIPITYKSDPSGINKGIGSLQKFAAAGAAAAAAIVAGFAKVSFEAGKLAAEFETSFSKIQGLVGVSASEIGELEDAAKELAPTFGRSATEAADALFFITSAGLRGKEAIEVLEASLKGTAVGLGETKTIADLATSAVNAYGSANLGGAEAVDILAEAVRLGKLEPAELAGSMGKVLPIASEMGVRFDEVGAALAGMSKTGTDSFTATTQLRQILFSLKKPTAEAERELERMGLSAQGLRDQIREQGLLSTLQTLTDNFGDNEEASAKVFGNVRALAGVLDLMGANAEDNAEIFRQMADDTGVLDDAMAITADTAEFKLNQAFANVKGTLLEVGEALLERLNPYLDDLLTWIETNGPAIEEGFVAAFDKIDEFLKSQTLANVIQLFKDLWPEIKETIFQLGELVEILIPVVEDALGKVIPLFKDTVSVVGDLAFFIDEVVRAMGGFEGESPSFVESILSQLNPIDRLTKAMETLAGWLTAAREAYERFVAAGAFESQSVIGIGGAGFGGRRAGGGPVSGGTSYLVGEMGPELFVPSGDGRIVPNDALGGSTINITVNAGMGTNGARVGEEIVSAIKRYERHSGPVFARA